MSVSEAVKRLKRRDPIFKQINLFEKHLTDSEVSELVDYLLAHPNVITHIYLGYNQLTDETGVKLARYVAASSTIELLALSGNQLEEATYLEMAAALRVNTSLQVLHLNNNQAWHQTAIDVAFIEALRLNPYRPVRSVWEFFSFDFTEIDFEQLKYAADALGAPSMLLYLDFVEDCRAETKTHTI